MSFASQHSLFNLGVPPFSPSLSTSASILSPLPLPPSTGKLCHNAAIKCCPAYPFLCSYFHWFALWLLPQLPQQTMKLPRNTFPSHLPPLLCPVCCPPPCCHSLNLTLISFEVSFLAHIKTVTSQGGTRDREREREREGEGERWLWGSKVVKSKCRHCRLIKRTPPPPSPRLQLRSPIRRALTLKTFRI